MSEDEIPQLLKLIERLEATAPLSRLDRFRLERDRRADFIGLTDAENEIRARRSVPRAPIAPKRALSPDEGNPNHQLGLHVSIVSAQFDDWFSGAHYPPPHSARRISAILKRRKLLDIRDRFEAALQKHLASLDTPPAQHEPSGDNTLDYLQSRVPRLRVTLKSSKEVSPGEYEGSFQFNCLDCGGYILVVPDDGDERGPAQCKACKQVFGTFGDVKALANHVAVESKEKELARHDAFFVPPVNLSDTNLPAPTSGLRRFFRALRGR